MDESTTLEDDGSPTMADRATTFDAVPTFQKSGSALGSTAVGGADGSESASPAARRRASQTECDTDTDAGRDAVQPLKNGASKNMKIADEECGPDAEGDDSEQADQGFAGVPLSSILSFFMGMGLMFVLWMLMGQKGGEEIAQHGTTDTAGVAAVPATSSASSDKKAVRMTLAQCHEFLNLSEGADNADSKFWEVLKGAAKSQNWLNTSKVSQKDWEDAVAEMEEGYWQWFPVFALH